MLAIRERPLMPDAITTTDLFCGGGGGSLGFDLALTLMFGAQSHGHVAWAVNHWQLAVDSHNANFPQTNHDCLDISKADPRRYSRTHLLIAGPSCTDHTVAKGKKVTQQDQLTLFEDTLHDPNAERTRVTMMDVPRFCAIHRYPLVIVENVVEVRHWWRFTEWEKEMFALGYQGKQVFFNSMFAGVPQSRDRWYYIFWQAGLPAPNLEFRPPAICAACGHQGGAIQTWKNRRKQWGKYGRERGAYFYRCAQCHAPVEPLRFGAWTAIDFARETTRIGDRRRPLAAKTMRRIQAGINRFGREPIAIDLAHSKNDGYARPLRQPWPTLTTAQTLGYAAPFLVRTTHPSDANEARKTFGLDRPAPTLTTRQDLALAQPFDRAFIPVYNSTDVGHAICDAAPTLTTIARHAVMTAQAGDADEPPPIDDWHFRMLHTDELRRVGGFPDAERYTLLGNERDVSRMIGQAMTPNVMALLATAALQSLHPIAPADVADRWTMLTGMPCPLAATA